MKRRRGGKRNKREDQFLISFRIFLNYYMYHFVHKKHALNHMDTCYKSHGYML